MTLGERIQAIMKKPENERTEEERITLAAFEDYKRRSLEKLERKEGE